MRKFSLIGCLILLSIFVFAENPNSGKFVPVDTISLYDIKDVKSGNITVHYSATETRTWDVGVIFTKNTENAIQCLKLQKEDGLKYKNYGVYNDVNVDLLMAHINARLNKAFKNQIHVQSTQGNTESIKCYIYVDLLVDIHGKSGEYTTLTLNLYYVNKNNEYLGQLTSTGFGQVSYPAFDVGVAKATKDLSYNLDAFLEGGADFIKR